MVSHINHDDKVMVVEDEQESRAYLVELLELEGFQVVEAANGAEALRYLEQASSPCLVIMDMRMPVMDGRQLRMAMLRDQRLAKIPVIVVTAFDPAAAANLSALRVLRKPVDIPALLATVREIC
jgi:CheY-like chemotaxis protein